MPLGSFKLNSISKIQITEEEYWIIHGVASEGWADFNIDSTGNIIAGAGYTYNHAKITTTGAVTWIKTNSSNASTISCKSNGDIFLILATTMSGQQGPAAWELASSNGSQNWMTARTHNQFGAGSVTTNNSCPTDSNGKTYVGWKQLDNSARYMLMWLEYDDSGNLTHRRWGTQVGSYSNNGSITSISVDASDNYYLSVDDQGSPNDGTYLTKFNSSSTHQWTVKLTWSTAPLKRLNSTKANSSGEVYGASGGRLWKLTSSQTRDWEYSTNITGLGFQTDSAVEVDSEGNAYFFGTASSIGYIFKINSAGTQQWCRRLRMNSSGATDSVSRFKCKIVNDQMYLYGFGKISNGDEVSFVIKVPTDGSKTGNYGTSNSFVYENFTMTLTSINHMTVTSFTPTFNNSMGSFTTRTYTNTLTNGSLTNTKVTIT
jgi:hypothetical protein